MSNDNSQVIEREIHALKETINALRDALESKQLENDRALQELRQSSQDHIYDSRRQIAINLAPEACNRYSGR